MDITIEGFASFGIRRVARAAAADSNGRLRYWEVGDVGHLQQHAAFREWYPRWRGRQHGAAGPEEGGGRAAGP